MIKYRGTLPFHPLPNTNREVQLIQSKADNFLNRFDICEYMSTLYNYKNKIIPGYLCGSRINLIGP